MAEGKYTDSEVYRRVLRRAKPYWPHLLLIFVLGALATPLALMTPLPIKLVVDSVIGNHPLPAYIPGAHSGLSQGRIMAMIIAMVLGIAFFQHLQGFVNWVLQTWLAEKLVLDFRSDLYRHVQRLSLSYHDRVGAADSVYRIQNDARAVQYIVLSGLIPLMTAAFTLIGVFWVTARVDWTLSLVAIAISPALLASMSASQRKLRGVWDQLKEAESRAMSMVQEALSSMRVVMAFSAEEQEQRRFRAQSQHTANNQVKVARIAAGFNLFEGLTIAAGTAMVLWFGVAHIHEGRLTLGELLMVMAYLGQLYGPLETISNKIGDLQGSIVSAARAFAVLDRLPDIVEDPQARPLQRARGAFSIQNVSFSYDGNNPVLSDLSLEVETGARIGIAGTTGSGKTSFVNLLTRFYDPSKGAILLDGVDIREYKLADLRNQFAIVLQDPVLFSASIRENIAYAKPEASEPEIIAAAKAANAHNFISRLPDGYQTMVGERGMMLSGGERQRVAIARAFLKDAPLLVLDEPTSSVDTQTETAIIEAMERLMVGRTTFMIAHRLSTLDSCDVRIRIENGRMVEVIRAGAERSESYAGLDLAGR